jgi:hypothetical protein
MSICHFGGYSIETVTVLDMHCIGASSYTFSFNDIVFIMCLVIIFLFLISHVILWSKSEDILEDKK